MSDRFFGMHPQAGRVAAWLGSAAATAAAACPPGQVPNGAGGCMVAPSTPSAICSAMAANKFGPGSPGYGTNEGQQKMQEFIAACIKNYEQQARSGGAVRATPPHAGAVRAATTLLQAAPAQREAATVRAAAPHERAAGPSMVRQALPDVWLTCSLIDKGVKWSAGGKQAYELSASHAGAMPLDASYRVHWAVWPLHAATTTSGGPAQAVVKLPAPLTPNTKLALGTVLKTSTAPLQKCTAVAKL